MNKLKQSYLSVEKYFSDKPFLTAIIISGIGLLIPITIVSGIRNALTDRYELPGYVIYAASILQLFTTTLSIHSFRQRSFKRRVIKMIDAILKKLESPFVRQSVTFSGKQVIEEKFYDYEMIRSFEESNDILAAVKARWGREFADMHSLTNSKRIHPRDWIPESELNGVKVFLLQLKERLRS